MKIDHYRFGEITVDGIRYQSDVKIFPNNVVDNWYRREGHTLHKEDLQEIIEYKPDLLIIGTGSSGVMKVPKEIEDCIKSEGIELVTAKTGDACNIFNESSTKKKVVAALHLTC